MRITGQGGSGQEVLHRLKTGGTYELRGFGRVSSATDSALIGIRFFDTGNATIADINQPVRATSFQNYTVRFTVPQRASSAKIYVWKESSSATTADFDDFSLTSMGPPANPPMLAAIGNPGGLQPAGAGNDWTLVFNDEFDGPNINPSVWTLALGSATPSTTNCRPTAWKTCAPTKAA